MKKYLLVLFFFIFYIQKAFSWSDSLKISAISLTDDFGGIYATVKVSSTAEVQNPAIELRQNASFDKANNVVWGQSLAVYKNFTKIVREKNQITLTFLLNDPILNTYDSQGDIQNNVAKHVIDNLRTYGVIFIFQGTIQVSKPELVFSEGILYKKTGIENGLRLFYAQNHEIYGPNSNDIKDQNYINYVNYINNFNKIGMNAMLLWVSCPAKMREFLSFAKTNYPGYKYIFSVIVDIANAYQKNPLPQINRDKCALQYNANYTVYSYLDDVIQLAKEFPDLVVGYYAFDEPVDISIEFQKSIYNYIRKRDLNPLARPVFVANTMYFADCNDTCDSPKDELLRTKSDGKVYDKWIEQRISVDAQDVFLIDQYSFDKTDQKKWYDDWLKYVWKQDNSSQNSTVAYKNVNAFIPVVTASGVEKQECEYVHTSDQFETVKSVIAENGELSNIYNPGSVGFYAFWPKNSWNIFDMSNCEVIRTDVEGILRRAYPAILTKKQALK